MYAHTDKFGNLHSGAPKKGKHIPVGALGAYTGMPKKADKLGLGLWEQHHAAKYGTSERQLGDPLPQWITTKDGRHVLLNAPWGPSEDAPKRFLEALDAMKWADEHYKPVEKITRVDTNIFMLSQDGMISWMNTQLRTGENLDEIRFERMKKLDAAISKFSTPVELTVFRGTSARHFGSIRKGAVIIDKGFVSTSLSRKFVQEWAEKKHSPCIFEYDLPKRFTAAYLGTFHPHYREEVEVLFPRGTKWRVVATKIVDGIKYAKLKPVI